MLNMSIRVLLVTIILWQVMSWLRARQRFQSLDTRNFISLMSWYQLIHICMKVFDLFWLGLIGITNNNVDICLYFAEIPYWLQFYSKAAQEHDHKLRWELFRLPELDCYDNVLKRLYKQELETIVMNYEAYRSAMARELERRRFLQVQQQQHQQQFSEPKEPLEHQQQLQVYQPQMQLHQLQQPLPQLYQISLPLPVNIKNLKEKALAQELSLEETKV